MNEYSQPGPGKIAVHGNGFGAATPEQVEQRAREIALIAERNPDEFTDADWEKARQELVGADRNLAPEEIEETGELPEEHEVVPGTPGHRAPRAGVDDDEMLGERLVSGGVEDATHDQMLEAAKEDQKAEG